MSSFFSNIFKRRGDEVDESQLSFFHGKLRVHVISAEGLPDTDTALFNIDGKDVTDPYVTGDLGYARIFKTRYIPNDLNPVWDEVFYEDVCHHASSFVISVKDKEHIGASHLASTVIKAEELIAAEAIEGWFDLINGDQICGKINLTVQYFPISALGEDSREINQAYFPLRENNRLTLYQDADTPAVPQFYGVTYPDGTQYEPTRAWRDLFLAVKNAEKFIYITGWSVYTKIQLVRGDEDPENESIIGELLKAKAAEGVKVLMMIWDEKLSTQSSPGLMGTYDEETWAFFQGTGVDCVLVSRAKVEGLLASEFVGTCYTHHQKTVICDAPLAEGSNLKRIIAFIGGLDITDGRYDSLQFPLFSTITTLHSEDFYNNCCPGATKEFGPREPWHDCHAKVEGPAALDIMKNFEERWCRQSEEHVQRLFSLSEDADFDLEAPASIPDCEGGLWNLQLFRSITSDSCVFDLERRNVLSSKMGRFVEHSIARCLIQRIRSAHKFIYMENQYFLGSAYAWLGDQATLTHHIIPREITQRICDKISSGEEFKCYILVPMFPEGDPSSAAIQEILFWQYRTMETMYKRIAKALENSGNPGHPTDYLAFFCLGKRESPDEVPEDLAPPPAGSAPEKVRQSMRHCIYVHSKMTIVDDDYILIGSANINQRSLDGNRDTEIAIGGYQPGHTVEEEGDARGDIHTYRMALWAAHLGGADDAYRNPSSEACMEQVRHVTRSYWELYTSDEPCHSDVHLLPYPINVEADGTVKKLSRPWNCFPDTNAKVLGVKSGYLPEKLTT